MSLTSDPSQAPRTLLGHGGAARADAGAAGSATATATGPASPPPPQQQRRGRAGRRGRTRRLVRQFPILSIGLTLIALGLAVRLADPPALIALRNIVFDEFQRAHPRVYDPALPVRIVAIDEASLERLGQWPWPRRRLAELVTRLYDQGAAAVALDMLLAEPDRTSPESILAMLPESAERDRLAEALRDLPRNDIVLAEAIRAGPTVLGVVLRWNETPRPDADEEEEPLQPKAGFAFAGDDPAQFAYAFNDVSGPLPVLSETASGLGAMNWVPDRDQIVRTVPLIFALGDTLYPSLATEALRVAQGASTIIVRASNASGESALGAQSGINAVRIGGVEVATNPAGAIRVHYTPAVAERFIPAADILDGSAPADAVAGRIVLVGATAPGLLDLRATPIEAAVPGVEIQAQAIEHILAGATLVRPDWAPALEMLTFVVLAALMTYGAGAFAAWFSISLGAATLIAVGAACTWAFVAEGQLIDPAFPLAAGLVVLVATNGYVGVREERARRQIRASFSRYISPDLVAEIAEDPSRLQLGGEIRPMTILFTDMRGFTTISEGMSAQELTAFLNSFLTPLTDVILKHRGTIDKYMGDAIMAFWNAPLDDPDHARHAAAASLAMLDALAALNASRPPGRPQVAIGIGLNTGECCVGNLGSMQRFDYSVIGDDVNIASRLEGQTKTYGVPIIAGPETVALAPEFAFIELDRVRVKGRLRPLDIHTLVGDAQRAADAEFRALREAQSAMLARYRGGDLGAAAAALDEVAALDRHGLLTENCRLYRERIAFLADAPLPAGWDGTHDLQTK